MEHHPADRVQGLISQPITCYTTSVHAFTVQDLPSISSQHQGAALFNAMITMYYLCETPLSGSSRSCTLRSSLTVSVYLLEYRQSSRILRFLFGLIQARCQVAYLKRTEVSTLLRPLQCGKTCGWIRADGS